MVDIGVDTEVSEVTIQFVGPVPAAAWIDRSSDGERWQSYHSFATDCNERFVGLLPDTLGCTPISPTYRKLEFSPLAQRVAGETYENSARLREFTKARCVTSAFVKSCSLHNRASRLACMCVYV